VPVSPAARASGRSPGAGLTMSRASSTVADATDAQLMEPQEAPAPEGPRNLDTILRIPVTVQVVLGSAVMPVANLMKLGRGTVIPLDHHVGEPVDIVVNGRVVARGEVVVADEETSRFGVSLTELMGPAAAEPKE
jgi:flagellar motor switch protein FliN